MAAVIFLGNVITMGDEMEAEAIVVSETGRILKVGSREDVIALQQAKTCIVDLGGMTMLPGLIEAHTHPIQSAEQAHTYTDLGGFVPMTLEQMWDAVRAKVKVTPPGQWCLFKGMNPILIKGLKSPTRRDLDAISTKHPIVMYMLGGHTAFLNSMAFEMAGITDDTPDPPNYNVYGRDENGCLNGRVEEDLDAIRTCPPSVSKEAGYGFLKEQLNRYACAGYTTVAATGLHRCFPECFQSLAEIVSDPKSPIRIAAYHIYNIYKTLDLAEVPGRPGVDQYCRIGMKWVADGSPYSGTMATADPYLDTPLMREGLGIAKHPCFGALNYTHDSLYTEMLPVHQQGWQIAVHTQGERAVDQVLDVYEALLKAHPKPDHRYRLEHCGLITQKQLARAKAMGVTPSFFVDHIYYFGRALRDGILGEERASHFMPLYTATREGHKWSLHSDTPVCPLDPFRSMKAAVTRSNRRELWENASSDLDIIGQGQRVSIYDALRAYTIHPAWQIFHDDVIGSIEVGKMADFTIVSRDPRRVDPYTLDEIEVLATYRNGQKVIPLE